MRSAFVATLMEIARADESIFLLTADLGWSVLEPFAQAFPRRFLNVGVAEQNLAGIATGLAQVGYRPFIYSIANFVTSRCFEQLRNGAVQHRLPVRVIGVGGGFAYGSAGPSHHALEDLSLCRTLPGMAVVAPADPDQTRSVILATQDVSGPVYVRVGKGNNPEVPWLNGRFDWHRPELVRDGKDLLFVTTGAIAAAVVEAAEKLARRGISAAVAVVAHLEAVPGPALIDLLGRFGALLSVEEGISSGGLGSLVAEAIAVQRISCRFDRLAVNDPFLGVSGSSTYLLQKVGLSAEHMVEAALKMLRSSHARSDQKSSAIPRLASGTRLARARPRPRISAIIACYGDEPAVPIMHDRLTKVFGKLDVDYEIIFVNDCSPDNARQVLTELAQQDPAVVVINHTRNFGSQAAFTSGMRIATGDAVVLLDGDLQDPPELIESFYREWQKGHAVVYGVRVQREAPWAMRLAYKAFYRVFRKLASVRIPLDAGDFSLLDRRVVDALNTLPESNRFVRGLRAWVGFQQTGVPYVRPERMFGRSTNNFWKNLGWARKAIFSFSYKPIDLLSGLGALMVVLSCLGIGLQVATRILRPDLVPSGFSTLIILILLMSGLQFLAISVIGGYISHIYDEVKRRPPFVVESILNPPVTHAYPEQPVTAGKIDPAVPAAGINLSAEDAQRLAKTA